MAGKTRSLWMDDDDWQFCGSQGVSASAYVAGLVTAARNGSVIVLPTVAGPPFVPDAALVASAHSAQSGEVPRLPKERKPSVVPVPASSGGWNLDRLAEINRLRSENAKKTGKAAE